MKLYLKASMKSWMHCTYDNNCSLWDTSLFSTILISMPTYTITHSIKIIWIFFLGIQDMPNCAYLAYSMQYLYHPICVFSSYGLYCAEEKFGLCCVTLDKSFIALSVYLQHAWMFLYCCYFWSVCFHFQNDLYSDFWAKHLLNLD